MTCYKKNHLKYETCIFINKFREIKVSRNLLERLKMKVDTLRGTKLYLTLKFILLQVAWNYSPT